MPRSQHEKITDATWSFLKPGDVIDVIAPSSPPSDPQNTINRITDFFKDKQLKLNIPDGLIDPTPVLNEANTLEKRVDFILDALSNTDSKAIWGIMGGAWGAELLGLLKEKVDRLSLPFVKPIIGYSDVTALHVFFNQHLGYPSLHAIELGANGDIEPAWNQTRIQPVLDLLMGVTPTVEYQLDLLSAGNMSPSSPLHTSLVGGNLLLVDALNGSDDFTLDTRNKTLFIESVALGAGEIARDLNGFRYSRIVRQADAVLIGNCVVKGGAPNTDIEARQIAQVQDFFARHVDIPVFHSTEFGHGPVNHPLPLNTSATFTIDAGGKTARVSVSAC